MNAALVVSAGLLGVAGAPHCAAMCSAPCAALVGRGRGSVRAVLAFQLARVAGYAAGGAIAASSVAALAGWSQASPALRPLWTLLHVAALALGLTLLWRGRQPAWMSAIGRTPAAAPAPAGWQRLHGPARAAGGGLLWVAWPCGLLQSALLVAALGNGAVNGALAMAVFAVASAPGLLVGPWLWQRLARGAGAAARERLAIRAAGALLAAAASWALGHGIWQRVAAFCATL